MKGPLRRLIETLEERVRNLPTGGYWDHDSGVYDNGKEAGYDAAIEDAKELLEHGDASFPLEFMDLPAREVGVHWNWRIYDRDRDGHYCRGRVLAVRIPDTRVGFNICLRCLEWVQGDYVRQVGQRCGWCERGAIYCESSGGSVYRDRTCEHCGGSAIVQLREDRSEGREAGPERAGEAAADQPEAQP